MLAGGDAEGYLRLFRYPCITPRAEFAEAKVYSGTIACARFLYGMRSLVTVGGTDASLMIWELAGKQPTTQTSRKAQVTSSGVVLDE